jgi:hypothetical protein
MVKTHIPLRIVDSARPIACEAPLSEVKRQTAADDRAAVGQARR